MNFSGISKKSIAGRLLRSPLKVIPPDLALPVVQGKLRGKKWIVGSSVHGCWLGSYEYAKQKKFASLISAGNVVFDVGAHAGFYSLLASCLVQQSGQVVAFEPLPVNLRYLHKHLTINHVSNVRVIEAAVGASSGYTRFKQGHSSQTGSIALTGGLEVAVVSLDTLVTTGKVPRPDFIKMDIEGGEYEALQGAETVIRQYHPTIFLATHSPILHKNCCEYLTSLGYQLEAIDAESIDATDELLAFRRD